jgi:hypothetical protein
MIILDGIMFPQAASVFVERMGVPILKVNPHRQALGFSESHDPSLAVLATASFSAIWHSCLAGRSASRQSSVS